MSVKTIGIILIVVGVVVAVVSAAADLIGLSGATQVGFGWKQQVGTAVGVIIVLVGVWLASRKSLQKK